MRNFEYIVISALPQRFCEICMNLMHSIPAVLIYERFLRFSSCIFIIITLLHDIIKYIIKFMIGTIMGF